MTKTVFLSYATKDGDLARDLRRLLQDQGLSVWMDDHVLKPGDDLEDALDQGIEQAQAVLVLFSLNAMNSQWVEREVQKAIALAKTVIPSASSRYRIGRCQASKSSWNW